MTGAERHMGDNQVMITYEELEMVVKIAPTKVRITIERSRTFVDVCGKSGDAYRPREQCQ
jgi:hypothetical protein